MKSDPRVQELARALADPLRLAVLQHLVGGPATVSELVSVTAQAQSKMSNHLRILRDRGLVSVTREGRRQVYELRDASVGRLVESMMSVAGVVPARYEKPPPLIRARTCYDHLAGRLGVALFDSLVARGAILQPAPLKRRTKTGPAGAITIGPAGAQVFASLGIKVAELQREHRKFAYACVDWTERWPHLGGALGTALWGHFLERGWIVKQPGTRAVLVAAKGKRNLRKKLGVVLDE